MKDIRSKVGVKICAWILFTLSAFSCCISVFGIGILLISDSYFDGGRELRYSVASRLFYSVDKRRINQYTENVLSDTPNIDEYEYDKLFSKENSNVFFVVTDDDGKIIIDHNDSVDYCEAFGYDGKYYPSGRKVAVTEKDFATMKEAEQFVAQFKANYNIIEYSISSVDATEDTSEDTSENISENIFFYEITSTAEKENNAVPETNTEDANIEAETIGYRVQIQYDFSEAVTYHVNAYIRQDLTAKDKYYYFLGAVRFLCNMRFGIIFIALACALACLLIVVFLCSAAGHKKNKEGIYLSGLHRVPLDLYVCLCIACVVCIIFVLLFILEVVLTIYSSWIYDVLCAMLVVPVCVIIAASVIVTFAVRIKHGKWWRNTIIYRTIALIKKIIVKLLNHLSIYWKALLLFAAVKIVEFICMLNRMYNFWIAEGILVGIFLIYFVISLNKIQKGSKEMASGNLDYHVDVSYMASSLRECGENLNNMSSGLKAALDEKMKSEHMKTELIANVSHDIKTPLTSIVNYVGLLKRDGFDSPAAQEYLDVIERQSKRLKKLTEDLVEASKATSGCINVNAENTDVNVLLSQAVAEYSDRFEASDLETIMDLSPDNPIIFADGRLLWRVFDNLFNNIRKYSLGGTRVYIRSEVFGDKCVMSFTNISREKLNISSDELMERFVRGDSSRNTEGSGLGLSIARSLTDLQGGAFDIKIDGDLFKATVTFSTIKENIEA